MDVAGLWFRHAGDARPHHVPGAECHASGGDPPSDHRKWATTSATTPRVGRAFRKSRVYTDVRRWQRSTRQLARGSLAAHLGATALVIVAGVLAEAPLVSAGEPDTEFASDRVAREPMTDSPIVNLHAIEEVQFPDVRDITQDRLGFIWIGVNHQIDGGLIRYDGYETRRYVNNLDDPRSLSHDNISLTYVDREGNLWVGTNRGGLNRYNAETDDFTRYLHDPDDESSLPSDDIQAMLQASDGTYWIGTETGLSRFDPDTGAGTSFYHRQGDPAGLPDSRITTIAEDPETGRLWIGTKSGLSIMNPQTETFRNYAHGDDPGSLSDDLVSAIARDSDGVWWLGTGAGLDRYNPETDEFAHISLPGTTTAASEAVVSILEDSRDRLWVGHAEGLFQVDRGRGAPVQFVDEYTRDAVIEDATVQALFEDADGAVWIGTRTEGVARISPIPPGVTYHRHDPNDPDTINSDFVARVDATADGLWLVTDASVEFFDGQRFTDYTAKFSLDGGWPDIHGILAAPDDVVWLGSNDGKLSRVDVASGDVVSYDLPPPADGSAVWPVARAANGDVWYRCPWGCGVGVLHENGESELLVGDEVDIDGPEQAYAFNTAHLFDEDEQVLWVTGLGLTRIDVTTGELSVFSFDPRNPDAVTNQLWSVDEGPDGNLWLASGDGVHEFDPDTGRYVDLHGDALPTAAATDARFGPDGTLWVVSGPTLFGFDIDTHEVTVYSAADDAASDDRMEMENWVSSKFEVGHDDNMYAPTLDQGLVAFSPLNLVNNPTPPPVVLTEFELFGQPVEVGSDALGSAIPLAGDIRLTHEQDTFTFGFAALGYEHPERNQFRYKLDGFDDDWQTTGSERRFATYTNVPAGSYVFRVQASNNSGVWTPQGLAVVVTIAEPWYESWWARLLAILGLLLVVVAVVRWRTSRQREHNRELRERLAERTRHQRERDLLLAQVQEQSERLQGTLAAAPVGVVLLGPELDVLLENRLATAEFASLATFDGDGRLESFADLAIPSLLGRDRDGAWSTATVIDGDVTRSLSVTVRPIDPDARSLASSPVGGGAVGVGQGPPHSAPAHRDDHSRGWVLLWDDITEIEALQQRRARQERLAAVGHFAAGIAHDVNNVLNIIGLKAELLTEEPGVAEGAREHLVDIARETANASKFITQVLDYSRQSVSQRERLDAATVIGTQVRRLAEVMGDAMELEFYGQSPATILADPIQLERVVLNLIRNAQDAVRDSGRIMVVVDHVRSDSPDVNVPRAPTAEPTERTDDRAEQRDGDRMQDRDGERLPGAQNAAPAAWVRIAVNDNGIGIVPDVFPTIFEPFVTTKPSGKGTGLGLAQVAGIAAEHRGRVSVETRVGIGTTVSVYFPALDPSESERADAAATSPLAARFADANAMVIDAELLPQSPSTHSRASLYSSRLW